MTDQITEQTVTWCRTHDWGIHAYLTHYTGDMVPAVKGLLEWQGDSTKPNAISFTSRKALRDWAGY